MEILVVYLYLIINKVNGKHYTGQTSETVGKRWKAHQNAAKNGGEYPLYNAIRKYGLENFEIKTLARCDSFEEANHREAYYIKIFKSHVSKYGYNIRLGGSNAPLCEEHKKKIGDAQRGKKRGPHTIGHNEKISIANTGRGKSEDHKIKLARANLGVPFTEDRKKNQAAAWETREGKEEFLEKFTAFGRKKSKPIVCNENGIIYPSIHEASRQLGLYRHHILNVLRGKSKYTKGYTFRWAV